MSHGELERLQAVSDLLDFISPVEELTERMCAFGWDYEGRCVTLKRAHLIMALERYITGQISSVEIERWANLIEGREDIVFETGFDELIGRLIYELANPSLTQALNKGQAQNLIESLS